MSRAISPEVEQRKHERKLRKREKLLQRYLRLQAQAKAAYGKMDDLLEKLIPEMRLSEAVSAGDGRQAQLVDNYATKNVSWKSSAHRRFEIKEVDHEKNRIRRNGSVPQS